MADIAKLQETLGIEIPSEVITPDGEVIPNDGEKISQGLQIISETRMDLCRISRRICEFFEEELYIYFGVSKNEAAEKFFGMSLRTVQNMQQIHRKLGGAYEELQYLGTGKLKAISELPEEQRTELIQDGVLHLEDGSELTIEEIAESRTKELEQKLKEQRLQISRLKNAKDEQEKEHSSEVESLKKEMAILEGLVDIPESERAFTKRIRKTRETQNQIIAVQTNFHAGFTQLAQIELSEENAAAEADITSLLGFLARQVLHFESYFGVNIGEIKQDLTA